MCKISQGNFSKMVGAKKLRLSPTKVVRQSARKPKDCQWKQRLPLSHLILYRVLSGPLEPIPALQGVS
jgi:hypothetical protein